jgi:exosome complex protein LRP1
MRLNGVDAKNHAIFTELTRIKQYFEKIQEIEKGPEERQTKLNTEASARFLKADLVSTLPALPLGLVYSPSFRRITSR